MGVCRRFPPASTLRDSAYDVTDGPHRKHPLLPCILAAVGTYLFAKPLLTNCCLCSCLFGGRSFAPGLYVTLCVLPNPLFRVLPLYYQKRVVYLFSPEFLCDALLCPTLVGPLGCRWVSLSHNRVVLLGHYRSGDEAARSGRGGAPRPLTRSPAGIDRCPPASCKRTISGPSPSCSGHLNHPAGETCRGVKFKVTLSLSLGVYGKF
jgi:hypothetical protein